MDWLRPGGGEDGRRSDRQSQGQSGKRSSRGEAVLVPRSSQHHQAEGCLRQGAEPVPGDGVRPRRQPTPGTRWTSADSRRAARLGEADRSRHALSTRGSTHPAHTPRPQVQQQ